MKAFMRLASATVLAIIAPLSLATTPALAAKAEPAKPTGPQFKLSKPVQKLLFESQKLTTASDFPGALAKLNEAAALPGLVNDEIYMINALSINIAIGSKDNVLLEKALMGALATGLVSVDDQPKFLRNLGAMAVQRNDYAGATAQFEKLVAMMPGDVDTLVTLGELSQRQRQSARAVNWMSKAIEASTAKGVTASEDIYRRRLAIAYDAKLSADSLVAAKSMVAAYPNPINWRDALTIFRDSNKLDDQTSLDVLRLMQTVGSLNGERDFAEYAETAVNRGLPGEARLALDDGIAKGMLTPTKQFVKEIAAVVNPKIAGDKASLPGLARDAAKSPTGKLARVTGDAMYGYAQYSEAAAMYRLALTKGGADVDVDQVNLRLGMVLARAGDKAGAIAAFDTLKTAGARQTIGQYWQIWLNRKA